ncbi:hypothetical protein Tco_1298820 [Tanacetum coccineum]
MLWGVVTGTNVDYAKLIWEEFIQAIKNFFSDMANIKIPTRKPKHPPKPLKKTTSKPTPSKKIHKEKRSDHLVDEKDNESQPATEPQVLDDEYNLQRGIQMSLESFQVLVGGVAIHEPDSGMTQKLPLVKGKGKGIRSDEQAAQSLLDLQNPKKKKHGEEVSHIVALEERTVELDEGQVRSDPGKTPESRPLPEHDVMEEDQAGSEPRQSHVAQARPNPEPMHEDFTAIVYPEVHES